MLRLEEAHEGRNCRHGNPRRIAESSADCRVLWVTYEDGYRDGFAEDHYPTKADRARLRAKFPKADIRMSCPWG